MRTGATIIVAMPDGGPKAPTSARASATERACAGARSRPNQRRGQVGKPQPLSARRCHHVPSGAGDPSWPRTRTVPPRRSRRRPWRATLSSRPRIGQTGRSGRSGPSPCMAAPCTSASSAPPVRSGASCAPSWPSGASPSRSSACSPRPAPPGGSCPGPAPRSPSRTPRTADYRGPRRRAVLGRRPPPVASSPRSVAAAGAVVVDNSSAWRMDERVPLVVAGRERPRRGRSPARHRGQPELHDDGGHAGAQAARPRWPASSRSGGQLPGRLRRRARRRHRAGGAGPEDRRPGVRS